MQPLTYHRESRHLDQSESLKALNCILLPATRNISYPRACFR